MGIESEFEIIHDLEALKLMGYLFSNKKGVKIRTNSRRVLRILNNLVSKGYVTKLGDDFYTLTSRGLEIAMELKALDLLPYALKE